MRKLILLWASFCVMALLISTSPVRAQGTGWVSATGNDANACTTVSPCASFQGVINKGGVAQINCLNSGYYLPFTVTASITIDCGTGNVGNIVSYAGNAITINTPAGATVVLRHLSLNGLGQSDYGIAAETFPSGALIVEDCMIQGFTSGNGNGIRFVPTSGRGLLQVSNSQVFKNTNGILVAPQGGQIASVMLDQVRLTANSDKGLYLAGTGVVAGTMRNSVAGANGGYGVYTDASQVYFTVESSSIVANLTSGIRTNSAGSSLKVAASTIGGNGTGVQATFGSLVSFGDNHVSDNGSDGNFTSTKALK